MVNTSVPASSQVATRRAWTIRIAISLVTLLLLAGGATALVAYEAADRLVHPARDDPGVTPADRGIEYASLRIPTADGLELAAWWMPTGAEGVARGTVVFLHGYGASKAQSLAVAAFLVDEGYHVLAFDFRAHGESEGTRTSVGLDEVADVRAALDHLRARGGIDMDRVILFGWSMGAATALNAAELSPEVRGYVLDSGFASLDNVVSHSLDAFTPLPRVLHPLILQFAARMAGHVPSDNVPAERARSVERPIFIIQGDDDPIARRDGDGYTLADAAGRWAQVWLVPSAGHVDARRVQPAEYEVRVLAFIAGAMAD